MPSSLTVLINRTSTDRDHSLTQMETFQPLGYLAVFPPEIRNIIYAHGIQGDYSTKWRKIFVSSVYYTLNREEPGHERFQNSYRELPKSPKSNISVFLLSKSIREEATMVFYSLGTFHFCPPYRWHYCVYRFPNLKITDRMMNVELSYNIDPSKILIIGTARARDAADWAPLAWAGPAALFTGNKIKRKSALIELKMSVWSKDLNMIIRSGLFDVLKQLTGFKTVTLRLEVIQHEKHWEKWDAGLTPLLNDLRRSLEPALGHGTRCEPEPGQEWPMSRKLHKIGKIEFHPSDHLAKMAKMKDIVPHEAEQVGGAEADQLSPALQDST